MMDFTPDFRVIETLRWSAAEGPIRLEVHLARMSGTCAKLGLPFPDAALRAHLSELKAAHDAPHDLRIRLTVAPSGEAAIEHWPFVPISKPWIAAISQKCLESHNQWLAHKTTNRALYDAERAALPADVDEWLFLNERGEVCEGTITNVFVELDGTLVTPPLSSGLLPGILRAELIASGRAREGVLFEADLRGAQSIFCGNSLRGLISITLKA